MPEAKRTLLAVEIKEIERTSPTETAGSSPEKKQRDVFRASSS
ncbi:MULTISPECIES: hypothetical protein [Haloferax]|nr:MULTISPECIES: hypothetical protein [Haloferax]